jgi:Flp pilus assembly protein TadD
MSLLQDALRKAQRNGGAPTGQLPGSPAVPPPGRRATRWKSLAAVVTVAFVIGAASVVLLSRRTAPSAPRVVLRESPAAPAVPQPPEAAAPGDSAAAVPSVAPIPVASRPVPSAATRPAARRPRVVRAGPLPASPAGAGPLPAHAAAASPLPERTHEAERADVQKFNAAVEALDRGDASEAGRRFREVTKAAPDLVDAWNGLGLALLRQRRLEEADAAFSRVLSLAPRYVPGLMNAGLLRLDEGKPGEAAALFARSAELAPGSPGPRVNLAVALSRQGRYSEALETLAAARRNFPSDPNVLYHLGTVYDRIADLPRAAGAYAEFLAVSGGSRPALEERVRERLRALGTSAPQR